MWISQSEEYIILELANQKRGYTNTKAHITGIPGKEDQSKNTSRLTNQKKVKRKINHRAVCHNDYHLAPSEKKGKYMSLAKNLTAAPLILEKTFYWYRMKYILNWLNSTYYKKAVYQRPMP